MAINYITIFFAAVFFGVECRWIGSSNRIQAIDVSENREASKPNFLPHLPATTDVNDFTNANREFVDSISKDLPRELNQLITTQGLTVENLLTELIVRAVNTTNQEETAAQWLQQLKQILDEAASGIEIEKSSVNKVNDFGEKESTSLEGNKNFILIGGNNWLEDLQEMLDEQYMETENSEENKSDDESTSMDSATSYSSIDHSFREIEDGLLEQYDSEESADVDTELQNDISATQKPFGKLCRKHLTEK